MLEDDHDHRTRWRWGHTYRLDQRKFSATRLRRDDDIPQFPHAVEFYNVTFESVMNNIAPWMDAYSISDVRPEFGFKYVWFAQEEDALLCLLAFQ